MYFTISEFLYNSYPVDINLGIIEWWLDLCTEALSREEFFEAEHIMKNTSYQDRKTGLSPDDTAWSGQQDVVCLGDGCRKLPEDRDLCYSIFLGTIDIYIYFETRARKRCTVELIQRWVKSCSAYLSETNIGNIGKAAH